MIYVDKEKIRLVAEQIRQAHVMRLDAPDGLLKPRPYQRRRTPRTALITYACMRKMEERLHDEMFQALDRAPLSVDVPSDLSKDSVKSVAMVRKVSLK